jgi:RHS repeat-associated protein
VEQYIFDGAGRQAGERIGVPGDIGTAPWQCTSYDARGRVAQEVLPAANGSPARTVTYGYAVGGNPLVSAVSDASGTITSSVDLLGRVTSYTDVWGQTTTTSYNQAGQVTATSGPGGSYQLGYDPNTGQPTTTTVNGTLLATDSYDSAGRLAAVTYGNSTEATIGYDSYGRQKSLAYLNYGTGQLLTVDGVTYTLAGRESTETAAKPGGALGISYAYDGAGRLTQAADTSGGSQVSSYSYAASPGCPVPDAGANTNRTSVTIGTPTTGYCYNNADQLVSSTSGGTTSTSYVYNERGDQTNDNGTTYTWDSADRVATATTGSTTITSSYDAVNRLIQSASSTASTVRYSYAGYTDVPAAVLNASGAIVQQLVNLPGGVTVIVQPSGDVWSYTNLQGDTTATADSTGTLTSGPVTYDPWGNLNPGQTPPATTTGPNTLGAYAAAGKLTNTATATILLGARTFNPAEARFLSVDPVEGGCANPYTYAFGDPLNQQDLTGQAFCLVISAELAIEIGKAMLAGEKLDKIVEKVLDHLGVSGLAALLVAKALEILFKTEGTLLVATAKVAEAMAARSGRPGATGEVLLVFPSLHLFGEDTHIPIGPPLPIAVVNATGDPGPNNPNAPQNEWVKEHC